VTERQAIDTMHNASAIPPELLKSSALIGAGVGLSAGSLLTAGEARAAETRDVPLASSPGGRRRTWKIWRSRIRT